MKLRVILKRFSHPQVRRRLKIGLSLWAAAIVLSLISKISYDIGYFKAQSLIDEKNASNQVARQLLTPETAQRIVTGALKEDPNNPKTVVVQVTDNNPKLSTIIIENNKQKRIAWIIDLHLYFTGDLYSDNGYNLTQSMEYQNNIITGPR
ncbi:hypothetical protein PL263_14035 [Methylomonas sp. EFPC3]|uniref:hypothetical protein n=1 Tax=Methylomonas TaxID=416 RepID=UPI0011285D99|nr:MULTISPECIES: hypothetical protein [Methylomonas]TPQ25132.1 hypothetical protein C2U68_16455 [Methylomonas koyamae]WFP49214.1 hypothetical protein PL263_14035 [Methylomonas sp. EFPC3]